MEGRSVRGRATKVKQQCDGASGGWNDSSQSLVSSASQNECPSCPSLCFKRSGYPWFLSRKTWSNSLSSQTQKTMFWPSNIQKITKCHIVLCCYCCHITTEAVLVSLLSGYFCHKRSSLVLFHVPLHYQSSRAICTWVAESKSSNRRDCFLQAHSRLQKSGWSLFQERLEDSSSNTNVLCCSLLL